MSSIEISFKLLQCVISAISLMIRWACQLFIGVEISLVIQNGRNVNGKILGNLELKSHEGILIDKYLPLFMLDQMIWPNVSQTHDPVTLFAIQTQNYPRPSKLQS